MRCPRCDRAARVLESRSAEDGAAVRRRRECSGCGHRFTTYERRRAEPLRVRKRDGQSQPFDRGKLRAALLRSTHKRQVGPAEVERLVERVEAEVEGAGGELGAARIGDLCLDGLAAIDRGAYLQFLGTLPAGARPAGAAATAANPEFAGSGHARSVRDARDSSSLPARTGKRDAKSHR